MSEENNKLPEVPAELQWVEGLTNVMDTAIRIPGTNIRFGLDVIMGFIPFYGELATFGLSAIMVLSMVRHGVGGKVIIKMIWNVFKDAVIGAIPIFGDLYDVGNKANTRNLKLLKEHQVEGKHQGSGIGILVLVGLTFVALFCLLVFVIFYALYWVGTYLWGLI